MEVIDESISRKMAKVTSLLSHTEGGENSANEKLELLKMFVKFLESDKHRDFKDQIHKHGHHGKFGCGKFGFEKHGFGKHGFGKHGHGKHGHGRHGHGKHGHRMHGFGKHGHGHHGLHHHHKGRFWAHRAIDLTQDDVEAQRINENGCSPSPPPQEISGNTAEQNKAAELTDLECEFRRFRRHHHHHGHHGWKGRHHGGRWNLCPFKRNVMELNEIACQTEVTEIVAPPSNDEVQDNLTEMVENVNIEDTD